jgi:two-component sensor histidine kinase
MFELVADDVSLGLDKAIPCGIIVNELVSNSLKYAFPDGRKGKVRVGLRLDNSRLVTLTVGDNGVGVPAGLDFRNTDSLGLQLVSLLTVQLKGKISMAVGGNGSAAREGTEFTVVFSA